MRKPLLLNGKRIDMRSAISAPMKSGQLGTRGHRLFVERPSSQVLGLLLSPWRNRPGTHRYIRAGTPQTVLEDACGEVRCGQGRQPEAESRVDALGADALEGASERWQPGQGKVAVLQKEPVAKALRLIEHLLGASALLEGEPTQIRTNPSPGWRWRLAGYSLLGMSMRVAGTRTRAGRTWPWPSEIFRSLAVISWRAA